MSYTFQPDQMYRMPTHFGPATGPRRGPGGRKFLCEDNPKSTTIKVSFLSNAKQIEALLPPGFTLHGDPVVTVSATYMKEIEWLAGRGYNVLGVTIPARFSGQNDQAVGPFLTVLWENLADPIITGREELGFSKIYCELPEIRISGNSASSSASWLGFNFLDINVDQRQRPLGCFFIDGGDSCDGVAFITNAPFRQCILIFRYWQNTERRSAIITGQHSDNARKRLGGADIYLANIGM